MEKYKSVQERSGQDSSLAVAIAISGGGSRAANFGVGIMLGLEDIQLESGRNVLEEIDYLSTVSGGGFAGGAYIAVLFDHHYYGRQEKFYFRNYVDAHIRRDLNHSYASTLIKANLNPRFWFSYVDDGDALEKDIDDLVLGYKRRKKRKHVKRSILLGDVFVDKDSMNQKVKYPMLFANGSLLDKMVRFPFAPCILETYQINGYTHRLHAVKNKPNPYFMPLAIGIKASGSFPVLISNSTLVSSYHPERKYLHVVDGGLTDNLGYLTALDVLQNDREVKKKILFVVDADNSGNKPTFSKKEASQFSLKVLGKLPASGLDARRITLERDLMELSRTIDLSSFVFSFSMLIRGNNAKPPQVFNVKEEQKRLIRLLKEDIGNISPTDIQILYELVIYISTKYSIKEEEQELLMLTGKKLVHMNKDKIIAAFRND